MLWSLSRKEFSEEMNLKMKSEMWTGGVGRNRVLSGKEKSMCKGLKAGQKHGALQKQKAESKTERQKGQSRGSQSAIPGLAASAARRYLLKGKFPGLTPGLSNPKVGWDFILRLMKHNWGFK